MKKQDESPSKFPPVSEKDLAWEEITPEQRAFLDQLKEEENQMSPEKKAEQVRLAHEAAEEGRKKYGQMPD